MIRGLRINRGMALAVSFALVAIAATPAQAQKRIKFTQKAVPGEVVVQLRDGRGGLSVMSGVAHTLTQVLGETGVLSMESLKTDDSILTLKLAKDADVSKAVAALQQDPAIEFAEPNYIYHTLDDGDPNDPDFSKLWSLKNTGQTDTAGQVGTAGVDIHVSPLWQKGVVGSRKILVAVIDTGIDWEHPDLKGNIYTNPKEIPGDGKDNDGNGFVDDIHGWNFNAKTADSRDDNDHGSHCAGTIGATGNNSVGITGINWEVSLLPVKFIKSDGTGSLADAVEAINYARIMKANVMSNSWGGGGASNVMKTAIEKAQKDGILFIAAAGNDAKDNDQTPTYPASYGLPNMIAVAATDNQDKIASFSNWGKTTVHVAAPGVKIYSTTKGGKYAAFSGTSMATPHVAGAAALLLAANPTWTFGTVKDRIINTAVPVQGLKRKVVAKGRMDVYNAFNNIVPAPIDPPEDQWIKIEKVIESKHPYEDNSTVEFEIAEQGAKFIRVHFDQVKVEKGYDRVIVSDGKTKEIEQLTGEVANYTTEYATGDRIKITLKSDSSTTDYGFKIDYIQVVK